MRTSLARCLTLTALSALPTLAHAADAPQPLATYKTESGFIDDAYTVRDDGKAVAYVTTDGASGAQLHLVEIGGKENGTAAVSTHVSAIHWLGPERVLVVARDPDKQTVTAQVFGPTGAGKEKPLGPATDITVTTIDGKPAVVSYTRVEKKTLEHTLAAVDRDTWKPLGKKLVLREDAEGRVPNKAGAYKILWWRDGYTVAAVQQAGDFDKAKDMRRPERFARLDVWKNQIVDAKEIEDVLGFAKVALEHKQHDNAPSFVYVSEDRKQLLYVDALSEVELKLPKPLNLYNLDAVQHQILDENRLIVAASIDPQNPPAVARKKSDVDDLEVYSFDRKSHTATLALQLPGESRPTSFHTAGGRIAILRKSKGFDRGGVALQIYELK